MPKDALDQIWRNIFSLHNDVGAVGSEQKNNCRQKRDHVNRHQRHILLGCDVVPTIVVIVLGSHFL